MADQAAHQGPSAAAAAAAPAPKPDAVLVQELQAEVGQLKGTIRTKDAEYERLAAELAGEREENKILKEQLDAAREAKWLRLCLAFVKETERKHGPLVACWLITATMTGAVTGAVGGVLGWDALERVLVVMNFIQFTSTTAIVAAALLKETEEVAPQQAQHSGGGGTP